MESFEYFREIASRFQTFRENDFLCDTVLVADGRELKAHSVILAAASPLFKMTFEASGEPGLHYINLPGYDSTVVEIALNYIYTGDIELPKQYSESYDLLELFASLQNLGLKLHCLGESDAGLSNTLNISLQHDELKEGMRTKFNNPKDEEDCSSEQEFVQNADKDSTSLSQPGDKGCEYLKQDDPAQFGDDISEDVHANMSSVCSISSHETLYIKQELDDILRTTGSNLSEDAPCDQSTMGQLDSCARNAESDYVISLGQIGSNVSSEQLIKVTSSSMTSVEPDSELDLKEDPVEAGRKKLFPCMLCNKTFNHPNYLEVHSRIHTGEKPFVCKDCGRQFSQRANLNRHALCHSGEKPHLCHICGKAYIQKTQLDDHLFQHRDDLIFTCKICSDSFKDRSSLRHHVIHQHSESHLNMLSEMASSKVNVCETCGKSYTTLGGLRMHARVHSGHLFPCNKCQKAYVNRALLLQHVRSHTKEKTFECETCGKAFVYKNALTVHRRVHTGEKPYKCLVCGSSYAQFGHLQSHKKTHTGEKPFTCGICGKSYRQKVDLRLHTNRVHRDGLAEKSEAGPDKSS